VRNQICQRSMLLVIFLMIFPVLNACLKSEPEPTIAPAIEGRGLPPNPAEAYCIGLGYEHITRKVKYEISGSQPGSPVEPTPEMLISPQAGAPVPTLIPVVPDYFLEIMCVFPDGNECEEEEFASGRCGQAYSYCVQQGHTLQAGSNQVPGAGAALCLFPDGSSCPEFALFNGDCGPAADQDK